MCLLLAALLLPATELCAQSLDPNTPAPVRSSSVTGRIAARDLGDARLTDHYFAFTGTPGDLLITVQSMNLNGDIDVFTAGTLRPLLKLTLYAETSAPATKSIYLRRRENLILRVEARSPNDDEGTYRLSFGGSFEPIVGGPDIAETETPAQPATETTAGGRKTKRVSSVGARINEPEPPPTEVAATPTPEPTPEPSPEVRESKPAETPKSAEEKPAETTETARPAPRNTRGGRRPPRRSTPRNTETVRTPTEQPSSAAPTETTPEPKPEPPPETGPRLVIETNDGTLINRPMSGVKRVTVERGQVVVVGNDGKIDRFLLANVVRVSIAP
ncbi:MAG TPA: hypothetical protein VJP89_09775 [Pyrinomonadaceae bacterium]|nr:hypothetical protein [Pyrinomonadaceae bacterium]